MTGVPVDCMVYMSVSVCVTAVATGVLGGQEQERTSCDDEMDNEDDKQSLTGFLPQHDRLAGGCCPGHVGLPLALAFSLSSLFFVSLLSLFW